ncbi:FAD-dependent oxidoreductase [Streptomyces sp. NPDC057052]|uniref:FAD-dependent oxidoreductase n=1 Tax=Streptomyces sp. NPDC057052 TaxID=3346010 RepID=UPI00363436F5
MEHIGVTVIGGGQSGLATAHALLRRGLRPVVLEASDRAAGSWPRCHDSRTLFSPARYGPLPGLPFPGADRDRYPHRDESSPTPPPTPAAWRPTSAPTSAPPPYAGPDPNPR